LTEWTTPVSRNTPSTTNPEEEETVDAPGNDGNASMPELVKRPNPWRKKKKKKKKMMIFRNTREEVPHLPKANKCSCGLRGPPSWAWQECN